MTVVRITIKKILTGSTHSYRRSATNDFSNDYLVQTDASFPSSQLEAYALNIAQAESRLYPTCVHFKRASVKLATPGASAESLRGQFSQISLSKIHGQFEMGEEDALAFPPVAAIFGRNAQWGNGGRFLISHAVTATEWNLYNQKRVVPLRFQNQNKPDQLGQTPALSFSRDLIEAIRPSNGTYVLPSTIGDTQQRLRRVQNFVFQGFQVSSSKPKRKTVTKVTRRSYLGDEESETDSSLPQKSVKPKVTVEGVVYLLQGGQWFKIGKSINPDKRLTQIKLQIPFPVEVVHIIRAADPLAAEAHWHRRFASLRQNGEWFLLTDAEVNEFKSVSEM